MSLIRKHLTGVAVDTVTDFLKEKFEQVKQLDLDQDGRKDVDQMLEILESCGRLTKTAIDSTDFQKLATGLDQIILGFKAVTAALDAESLSLTTQAYGKALKKMAQLGQLGIQEIKERGSLADH